MASTWIGGAGPSNVPGRWTANHLPSSNTQATVTRAAPGPGLVNVCTGLTVTLAAGASAPAAVNVSAKLIDGASGGSTVLWGGTFSLPATAGASTGVDRTDLWILGSANTAMTLEFSAAGGNNTIESVSFEGTTAVA